LPYVIARSIQTGKHYASTVGWKYLNKKITEVGIQSLDNDKQLNDDENRDHLKGLTWTASQYLALHYYLLE